MDFPAFVLAAVIVPDADISNLEAAWQSWKAQELGASDYPVHEPDVRKRKGRWAQQSAIDGLRETLEKADFTAIVPTTLRTMAKAHSMRACPATSI
jgi:hypothetical protein